MAVYLTFILVLLTISSVHAGRVLLSLYALELGAKPFAVGLLAATSSVLPMLLSWEVGRLTDRFGSRWPLIFGITGGICGMLAPYYGRALPVLYIAAAANGLMFAFCGVSLQNLVGVLSIPEDRPKNFSNFSLTVSAASFCGPLIAGFSIDLSGHAMACLYIALLPLIPGLMLLFWGGGLPGGTHDPSDAGSIKDLLSDRGLWRVMAASSMIVIGVSMFQIFLPIYGHDIGLSASTIGIVLAVFSAAAFVVRTVLPRLIGRLGEEKLLVYVFFFGAAALALVPLFQSAPMLVLVSFAFGLGMGCGQPITIIMTFCNSAKGRSGETLGLRVTANHLVRTAGPAAFGAVGSAFGVFPVFWIIALMLLLAGVLMKNRPPVGKNHSGL